MNDKIIPSEANLQAFANAKEAIRTGDTICLQNLFNKPSKFLKSKILFLLTHACEKGQEELFPLLVRVAQKHNINISPRLLVTAAFGGSVPLANHLLSLLTPPPEQKLALCQEALIIASAEGHEEMARFLKHHVKDVEVLGEALSWACHNGHEKVAKLLLSKETATYNECRPLQWALKSRHDKIVVLLLPHSNLKKAIAEARKKFHLPDNIFNDVQVWEEKSKIKKALEKTTQNKVVAQAPFRKM